MLAKALAHFFDAKLLILDVTDFSLKLQSKLQRNCSEPKDSVDPFFSSKNLASGLLQRLVGLFSSDTNASSAGNSKAERRRSGVDRRQKQVLSIENNCHDVLSKLKQNSEPCPAKGSALKRTHSWAFEDRLLVVALYKVLVKLSEIGPTVLYLRDVEKLVFRGPKTFSLFQKIIRKISGPVLILGSRILESSSEQVSDCVDEKLATLFPYSIDIKPPEDNARLVSWRSQLEEDMKAIQSQDNRNHISEVLAANDVECDDLASICFTDTLLVSNFIEEIVVSAISHHLMNTDEPQYQAGRLVISAKSLAHGLSLFQAGQLDGKDAKLQMEANPESSKESQETSVKVEGKRDAATDTKSEVEKLDASKSDLLKKAGDSDGSKAVPASSTPKESVPDNEFEKRIRPEVIPAGEIGISFQHIGALDNVKESLQELVMLPLRRPELFNKQGLIKPCKGILLFGPPGTGKTMLAKAVATEAGASFINVSMSTITSKWFGEDEKNVRALFSLAAKVAPTVIFIDEVDSMLGQRSRAGEHEAMRKIKNEFMAHWDGLLTKSEEQVLVLAATNRPFDLDEAIIRRFERRIMVGLPDKDNRERILRAILAKEELAEGFDFAEIAAMTEGYSGSDLKNLCTVAAYRPIRELMIKEKKENEKKSALQENNSELEKSSDSDALQKEYQMCGDTPVSEKPETSVHSLRPLNMDDMKQARNQVSCSFSSEGAGMAELKEWNELYGEGGSRKKQQLTYFL